LARPEDLAQKDFQEKDLRLVFRRSLKRLGLGQQSFFQRQVKFRKRFAYVEQGVKANGRALGTATLDEMEALWQKAKSQ
jgi:hypothetical protein